MEFPAHPHPKVLLSGMVALCVWLFGLPLVVRGQPGIGHAPAAAAGVDSATGKSKEDARGFKVGLVLSGGGALGMAHIGVISALEENGIPIDYVVGTSAGALVGAMYAAGYSPAEMRMLAVAESQKWLAPGLMLQEEYYFRRADPDGTFISVPFSLRGSRARVPNNLFSDTEINFGLLRAMTGASAVANGNFDSLLVPYRAIASDIFEKKAITIGQGSLAFAVRASIAVPLFFPPASNDQHTSLFDGGVYDNFPVEPMQEVFRPDHIIGVDVAGPLEGRELLEGEGNFFRQMLSHAIDQRSFYKMPPNGTYIAPDLSGSSSMDFSPSNVLFCYIRGYNSAMAVISELKARIPARRDSSAVRERRAAFRQRIPPPILGRITLTGVRNTERIYAKQLLGLRLGRPFSYDDIHRAFVRLRGEGNYASFMPELVYQADSQFYDLRLSLKPSARFRLKLGGAFFTPTDHSLEFGAEFSGNDFIGYTAGLHLMRGSFENHAILRGRLYIPTRKPLLFEIENRIVQHELQLQIFSLFSSTNKALVGYNEVMVKPSFGIPLLTNGKLMMGYGFFSFDNRFYRAGQPTIGPQDESEWAGQSLFATFQRSSLGDKMYARNGAMLYMSVNYNQAFENFKSGSEVIPGYSRRHYWMQARISTKKFIQFNSRVSIGLLLEAAASNLPPLEHIESTILSSPKFTPLPDSPILFDPSLYSKAFAAPGLTFVYSLNQKLAWHTTAYLMHSFFRRHIDTDGQIAEVFQLANPEPNIVGCSGLVYETPIGPVGLFLNAYSRNETPIRPFLHLGYMIFSRHPWD